MALKSFNIKFVIGLAIGLVAGILIMLGYSHFHKNQVLSQNSPDPIQRIGVQNPNYKFINPLLGYDYNPENGFPDLKKFEQDLQTLTNNLENGDTTENISIYFRDLNTGHAFDINPQYKFYPASLLKVPLMIAIFKQSETNPDILKQKLFYDGKQDANVSEFFKPENPIKPNQAYTVSDLIEKMIVESDNNATNLLVVYLDDLSPTAFDKVYQDFGVSLPDPAHSDQDFLTPRSYSLFLRILRNATYLSEADSEAALELLVKANFKDGLAGGIPADVPLGNKFGEALSPETQPDGTHLVELHDCGVVYQPKHNYLICVMTKGKTFTDLASDIKNISQFTYNAVKNNYK